MTFITGWPLASHSCSLAYLPCLNRAVLSNKNRCVWELCKLRALEEGQDKHGKSNSHQAEPFPLITIKGENNHFVPWRCQWVHRQMTKMQNASLYNFILSNSYAITGILSSFSSSWTRYNIFLGYIKSFHVCIYCMLFLKMCLEYLGQVFPQLCGRGRDRNLLKLCRQLKEGISKSRCSRKFTL